MKHHFLFSVILLFCVSSCSTKSGVSPTNPTQTPISLAGVAPTYQLVWSDEFEKEGLPDTTKWGYDVGSGGWGNKELEYYTKSKLENARVEKGNLIIEARIESFGGRNYTSARLLTKNKAQWTYGKFEVKAKLPRGRGLWPAIWMLSAKDPLHWPDDGELDIMEEVGFNQNVIHGTVHNKAFNGANGKQKGGEKLVPDADKAFHIYSMEWLEREVNFSIDGLTFFTYYNPGLSFEGWPYDKDFFMILNVAVGGNWGGIQGIDDTVFPQQMVIDYVRVYQEK